MKVFGLADCNNFYASCQRLFRPDLIDKPIICASNNDGCAIARSAEAKALGVKMGAPLYQIQDLIKKHDIYVFSPNFELYADISARVMQCLESCVPATEIYSIDESFLDLTGISDLLDFSHTLKQKVQKHVGIPISIGISSTKTLAKLANYAAKKYPITGGVVDLTDPQRQRRLLAICPVSEVWGVGRKLSKKLQHMGIMTALDLANMPTREAKKRFSIVLERTVIELNGESCIELEPTPATRQQVLYSRSFGEKITDLNTLVQAVSEFASRAAERLRSEGLTAAHIATFIRTNAFDKRVEPYSASAYTYLSQATSDSRQITGAALNLLRQIYKDGLRYAKAGVILSELSPIGQLQPTLFSDFEDAAKSENLMKTIDQINNKNGTNTIYFGNQKKERDWFMRQEHRSPSYTTNWDDIPTVR